MAGIYGNTLGEIAALTVLLDNLSVPLEDAGIRIEEVPLLNAATDRYIGTIVFDADGHAVFEPEEDEGEETYVLTDKGMRVLALLESGKTYAEALVEVESETEVAA